MHLGLTHSPQHFSGVVFQFVDSSSSQSSRRRVRRLPLATGGRYDGLLGAFRRPGKQSVHPGVSVVGVSVLEEMVVSKALSAYAHGLVSWGEGRKEGGRADGREGEGGREGGRKGGREGGWEGRWEGGREGGKEGRQAGRKEERRNKGRKEGRKEGRGQEGWKETRKVTRKEEEGGQKMEGWALARIYAVYLHFAQCPITKCSVLVCWLGRESLQNECIRLVKELWSQGVAADLVYESLELDSVEDIQEFCRRNFIPHVVVLSDRTLFFERKQVKVRTSESGKWTEKIVNIGDLVEFLQQRHGVERSDSLELREGPVRTSSSHGGEPQSNVMPPVNVNIVGTGKLPGHLKRRYHDQVCPSFGCLRTFLVCPLLVFSCLTLSIDRSKCFCNHWLYTDLAQIIVYFICRL